MIISREPMISGSSHMTSSRMMEKTMEARGSVALTMLASWARIYLVLVTYSQKEAAVPSTQM